MAQKVHPRAPEPKSLLGYHRLLSPTAGVRVSPLCLGALNFGDAWKSQVGECTKENSFAMLDFFWEQGGNFIDTANNYQNEESETWLGEWMALRKNRDQMVLATKFTNGYRTRGPENIKSNYQGNHSKSLRLSVRDSLRKLQTDYIDVLYVHWWDFTTSIPELMNSLHHLIINCQVLYLGISDTPAWIVVKCNEYARHHGLTQFSVYQGHWSAAFRDFERDIIPMCRAEGMGIAPWGCLGQGQFRTEEEYKNPDREGRKIKAQDEAHRKVGLKLAELATKLNTLPTSIALAYVMHKTPYVFPVVGGRKVEHLRANVEALSVKLSSDEIEEIEAAEPFDVGFPMHFLFAELGSKFRTDFTPADLPLIAANWHIQAVEVPRPIEPRAPVNGTAQ